MNGIGRRLDKLEARHSESIAGDLVVDAFYRLAAGGGNAEDTELMCRPGGAEALTDDELNIYLLVLNQAAAAAPDASDDERAEAVAGAEIILADIRQMAAQQASPGYARHLDWCRSLWRKRTGRDEYQPAITGALNGMGEYDGWEKPRVMDRRAALRERLPALIGGVNA
jgi:hypothetical protein